jgi:hypothetical protein
MDTEKRKCRTPANATLRLDMTESSSENARVREKSSRPTLVWPDGVMPTHESPNALDPNLKFSIRNPANGSKEADIMR